MKENMTSNTQLRHLHNKYDAIVVRLLHVNVRIYMYVYMYMYMHVFTYMLLCCCCSRYSAHVQLLEVFHRPHLHLISHALV